MPVSSASDMQARKALNVCGWAPSLIWKLPPTLIWHGHPCLIWQALVAYIDGDNSGSVTFLEFVAALGLVEDVASTRWVGCHMRVGRRCHMRAGGGVPHPTPPTPTPPVTRPPIPPPHHGSDLEETSSSLSESGLSLLIMQQICTALYQLDHSLQKAFIRIDQRGEGWLEPDKFARALQLVASIPGSDRRAIDDWQARRGLIVRWLDWLIA